MIGQEFETLIRVLMDYEEGKLTKEELLAHPLIDKPDVLPVVISVLERLENEVQ